MALGDDHISDSNFGLDLLHADHSVFSSLLANAEEDLIDDDLICSLKLELAINENRKHVMPGCGHTLSRT